MPQSPGGDDVAGTDPLSELLSWGELESAADTVAAGDAPERGSFTGAAGTPTTGAAFAPDRESLYLKQEYGPVGYEPNAWPGPASVPAQWPGEWTYREPPRHKAPKRPPRARFPDGSAWRSCRH